MTPAIEIMVMCRGFRFDPSEVGASSVELCDSVVAIAI